MYEAFYGLTGKPFQLNPDPAFYFGSKGHKRAFAYLQYGLYQSEGFIDGFQGGERCAWQLMQFYISEWLIPPIIISGFVAGIAIAISKWRAKAM